MVLWPKTLWYEALKTQICLFPHAPLRKLHIAAPFSYTRPQSRPSYLVRCGEINTPEFTDSPLKLPVLLTIERWTHYYSAELEGGKKSSDVVWEILKRARYRLIIRCCTIVLKNKFLLILCSKNPICFLYISFFISFLSLPVHHEEQKCSLI